jgi:hypothetical protein
MIFGGNGLIRISRLKIWCTSILLNLSWGKTFIYIIYICLFIFYLFNLNIFVTMQVLHPSLHSSFLNSSFLIVYTIEETWIKNLERNWME